MRKSLLPRKKNNKSIRIIFTTFFGVGKVISLTGQAVYGLAQTLLLFKKINGKTSDLIIVVPAIASLYVRIYTRIPSLWQLSENWNIKKGQLTKKDESILNERKSKFFLKSMIVVTIIAGLFDTMMSYVGGENLIDYMDFAGVTKKPSWLRNAINAYVTLPGLVVYYAFVVGKSKSNIENLILTLRKSQYNFVKASILLSFGGAFSFAAFAYVLSKAAIENLIPETPNVVTESIAIASIPCTLVMVFASRFLTILRYLNGENFINEIGTSALSKKDKTSLFLGHVPMGSLDVLTYAIVLWVGCLQLFMHAGIPEIASIILSILPAMSGGLMHYTFSARPIWVSRYKKKDLVIATLKNETPLYLPMPPDQEQSYSLKNYRLFNSLASENEVNTDMSINSDDNNISTNPMTPLLK